MSTLKDLDLGIEALVVAAITTVLLVLVAVGPKPTATDFAAARPNFRTQLDFSVNSGEHSRISALRPKIARNS